MQAKNIPIEEVHDVRTVRIIVGSLAVVMQLWNYSHHLATFTRQFDDYIAMPKENSYQSIHTAVTADDGNTLEVQIRTQEMHEDAELGVCAHWAYKSGSRRPADEDASFAAKMNWLRQVMEWHDELGGAAGKLAAVPADDPAACIHHYAKGHVVDLAGGATVVTLPTEFTPILVAGTLVDW